jgi:hypothetical protein
LTAFRFGVNRLERFPEASLGVRARSLAPLEKTRGFGMTPTEENHAQSEPAEYLLCETAAQ